MKLISSKGTVWDSLVTSAQFSFAAAKILTPTLGNEYVTTAVASRTTSIKNEFILYLRILRYLKVIRSATFPSLESFLNSLVLPICFVRQILAICCYFKRVISAKSRNLSIALLPHPPSPLLLLTPAQQACFHLSVLKPKPK